MYCQKIFPPFPDFFTAQMRDRKVVLTPKALFLY